MEGTQCPVIPLERSQNRCPVIPSWINPLSRTVQRYNDLMSYEMIMTLFPNDLPDFPGCFRVAACSTALATLRLKHLYI
jgi:hypothetical protein